MFAHDQNISLALFLAAASAILPDVSMAQQGTPSAVASPDRDTPGPNDAFIGVRVLKNKGTGDLKWSVQLPETCSTCRTIINSYTSGQNPKEFYFHFFAPSALKDIQGVQVKVNPTKVRGVLVDRSHVDFRRTADGIQFDVARHASVDRVPFVDIDEGYTHDSRLQGPMNDVTAPYTYIDSPGVRVRIEHADIERRNGDYAGGRWPAIERQAALNLEFAAREAIKALGLDHTLQDRGLGVMQIMGFDTSAPTLAPNEAHNDSPPHWHMHIYWTSEPIARAVGHFYIGPDGLLKQNCGGDSTISKPDPATQCFERGQTVEETQPNGMPLYTVTITPKGYYTIAAVTQTNIFADHYVFGTAVETCHLTPVKVGFQTGVDLACDNGAPPRRIRAEDDVNEGRLRLFINDRLVEVHSYDIDNGSLQRSEITYGNR
jgi:hypothetical protein